MKAARQCCVALLVAVALLHRALPATAFPTYLSSNGTTTIESAFGGNVVLSPATGGAWPSAARSATRAAERGTYLLEGRYNFTGTLALTCPHAACRRRHRDSAVRRTGWNTAERNAAQRSPVAELCSGARSQGSSDEPEQPG